MNTILPGLQEELVTPRLMLRRITPELMDALYTQATDGEIMAYLGLPSRAALDKEKERYSKGLRTFNRSFLNFNIIDRQTSNTVGACGFHTWYTEHSRAEIGYAITDESYRRKGLMSEALLAVIKYGFRQMQLHRIEAFIGPSNEASIRLVQRLGFVQEGHLRQHYFKNGVVEDSLLFSLLRQEYL